MISLVEGAGITTEQQKKAWLIKGILRMIQWVLFIWQHCFKCFRICFNDYLVKWSENRILLKLFILQIC